MATPTRSQAVSTPKGHLPSTPNRPMASPRPGSSAVAQKSLAYKSPAVKTPASAYGHGHSVSVSSQRSSTPLAATTAIHDELLNLNSPAAALINSIAPTGMTSMTSGQDGLGISNQGGVPASGDDQATKDPENLRLTRLREAMAALKSKAVGRGVTRESVERVARLQGFEALWDEDNLTIAGNIVEIEINFDLTVKDRVLDMVLKLNSADGESHVQHEASEILKDELGAVSAKAPTADLEAFARNIKHLAQNDHVNVAPNAFQVASSLGECLRKIWDEEKKRLSWRSELQHIRKGAVGKANFDSSPQIGLSVEYWHRAKDSTTVQKDEAKGRTSHRSIIGCEAGGPEISVSRNWLSPDIFTENAQAVEDDEDALIPDWINEGLISASDASKQNGSEMADGSSMPQTLNMHFICELEPETLLPANVAMMLNSEICPLHVNESRGMTYQGALQQLRKPGSASTSMSSEERWSRRVPYVSPSGTLSHRTHSYGLYSASTDTELWTVPVSKLLFSHPKNLSLAISVLRQYALVWSLLQNLIDTSHPSDTAQTTNTVDRKKQIKKRSNKDSLVQNGNGSSRQMSSPDSLPVDISVDVMSDPRLCKIEIFAPLLTTMSAVSGKSTAFMHLSFTVGRNGSITVQQIAGHPSPSRDSLITKVGKMIEATEDIGIVLSWLMDSTEVRDTT